MDERNYTQKKVLVTSILQIIQEGNQVTIRRIDTFHHYKVYICILQMVELQWYVNYNTFLLQHIFGVVGGGWRVEE